MIIACNFPGGKKVASNFAKNFIGTLGPAVSKDRGYPLVLQTAKKL